MVNVMSSVRVFAVALFTLAVSACSNVPNILQDQEKRLGTDDDLQRNFHWAEHYSASSTLQYPGFLIGVEKASQSKVRGPKLIDDTGSNSVLPISIDSRYIAQESGTFLWYGTRGIAKKMLYWDPKTLFVSHIVASHLTPSANRNSKECPQSGLFSAYASKNAPADGDYLFGYARLQALYCDIEDVLTAESKQPYTHIIVITMGWNTPQSEAIRNFNDLSANLMEASRKSTMPFHPLFIGVTWPSLWSVSAVSYPNKASDADELGMTWLNVLLNDVLFKVKARAPKNNHGVPLKIVAIGHSFGARATSRAVFSSPLLVANKADDKPKTSVDLMVLLEGAFSMNRFSKDNGVEGSPYRDYATLGGLKTVLTSSEHDGAVSTGFWAPFAGSSKSFEKSCSSNDPSAAKVHCVPAVHAATACPEKLRDLAIDVPGLNDANRLYYVDASNMISCNAPGTGGGAHSDIYRPVMGQFIFNLIQQLQ